MHMLKGSTFGRLDSERYALPAEVAALQQGSVAELESPNITAHATPVCEMRERSIKLADGLQTRATHLDCRDREGLQSW